MWVFRPSKVIFLFLVLYISHLKNAQTTRLFFLLSKEEGGGGVAKQKENSVSNVVVQAAKNTKCEDLAHD